MGDGLADELDHHLLAIELVRHRVLEDVPCQLRVLKYKIKSINSFGRFLYLHDKGKGEYGLSEANTTCFGKKRPYTAFLRKYGPLYKLCEWGRIMGSAVKHIGAA